jgi:hypothetical protein
MKQEEFKYRLIESTKKLIDLSQPMVTNTISENVEFLVEPNNRSYSNHLNELEISKLDQINQVAGQHFKPDKTSELLVDSGLVPLWINSEINRSTKSRTIVKLICSRRFRDEMDLNAKGDEFPPFRPLVALPPWYKEDKKFDINWKHQKLKKKWHALTWKWRFEKKRHKNKIYNA